MTDIESLTYFSHLQAADGYGRAAELHLQSLLAAGVNVYVHPTGDWSFQDTAEDVYRLILKPRLPTRWGVLHEWPPTSWKIGDCRWHVGYTMIEGTRAPKWYVRAVNKYAVAVMVPCQQNMEALEDSGITRPLYVVPHGLDDQYEWGDRTASRPVTFGILGTLTPRKGTDILLRCFAKAFPTGKEDVRLEIKVRGAYEFPSNDPRIILHHGEWPVSRTREWYQSLTAYVAPTRGEGFGLTLVEAMRCGCGVIATAWSGPADYLDSAYSYPLAIKGLRPTRRDWPQGPDFGKWAVPDEEHLVELLREIAAEPGLARAKGIVASRVMAERFALSVPGRGILEVIGQYDE